MASSGKSLRSSSSSELEKTSVGDTMSDTTSTNVQKEPSHDQPSKNVPIYILSEDVGSRQHRNGHNPSEPPSKHELKELECYEKLGYSFPRYKKWLILTVIFAVQMGMNFNISVYPNATAELSVHFNVSMQAARLGQMLFLTAYAFGCELWATWSEEYGRWPIMQAILLLVNL